MKLFRKYEPPRGKFIPTFSIYSYGRKCFRKLRYIFFMFIINLLLHRLEEGIRVVRVKDFIASHDRHQILRLRQIDDVVRPARDHVDSLDLITGNLKLHRFASVDIAFLNQTVTSHHNEQFPLGVVPMLALGDARTADVDGHLPTV